jgi:glycosyltransferase involved in cell wall biosynthesis
MRVLHVHSGNLYGGVETLLGTVARSRSVSPGVEHEFALSFPGRIAQELANAGATVHPLGPARLSRPWSVSRARRALGRLLETQRYDVVICHSLWPHAVFAPVVRGAGAPLAFWLHDAVGGQSWLERLARRTRPQLVICNSGYAAQGVPGLFPGTPMEVVYAPVELARSQRSPARATAVRAALDTAPGDLVIIQASRMEPWKGQETHLEALSRLPASPAWTCWLVGGAQRPHEQEYLQRLRLRAGELGIAARVRFVGQRSDIPDLLAAADIHCQPNALPEPFGIAFVEALAAGLPVVTFRLGGAPEIVNDEVGILVQPGDVRALAEALRALMSDGALRGKLGAAGPARARSLCDPARQLEALRRALARIARPSGARV